VGWWVVVAKGMGCGCCPGLQLEATLPAGRTHRVAAGRFTPAILASLLTECA
jgi:hypothetical protein